MQGGKGGVLEGDGVLGLGEGGAEVGELLYCFFIDRR
jgi:hypothetical protein